MCHFFGVPGKTYKSQLQVKSYRVRGLTWQNENTSRSLQYRYALLSSHLLRS